MAEVLPWIGLGATALVCLAGLLGSLVPAVPGSVLILLAAVVHGAASGFSSFGWGLLLVLAVLFVFAQVAQVLIGSWGARRWGGGRWAGVGAIVGFLVGTFAIPVPLVGSLVGAFVGAALFEALHRALKRRPELAGAEATGTSGEAPAEGNAAPAEVAETGAGEGTPRGRQRSLGQILRAGFGASVGTLTGMLAESVVALLMTAIVAWRLVAWMLARG